MVQGDRAGAHFPRINVDVRRPAQDAHVILPAANHLHIKGCPGCLKLTGQGVTR
jgi:hypothetical protein